MGAYRGYGQAESNYVREVMIDRLARRLGLDAVAVRRRNLLTPEELPFRNISGATYDSGDYARSLDVALFRIGHEDLRERQKAWWRAGRYVGMGVSCYVEFTGYPSSAFLGRSGARFGAYESVTIRMDRAGRAALYTGVSSFGQGMETTFAQVCASLLGLDPADVTLHPGDSRDTPYSVGGFASRTMIAGAGAIQKAATSIRDKMLRIAAPMLGAPAEALEVAAGAVRRRSDPSVQAPIAAVAEAALVGHPLPAGEDPGLEATAYYDPPASAYGYGTVAAQVEVDPRSGEFELQRYILVHDCGTQVNPMIVEGQIHGGIAQGLAAALYEELVYDRETGQLVNGTMVDYFMPTAADVPPFELDHLETPSPVTPFGIKGVGEGGHDRRGGGADQRDLRRALALRRRARPPAHHGRGGLARAGKGRQEAGALTTNRPAPGPDARESTGDADPRDVHGRRAARGGVEVLRRRRACRPLCAGRAERRRARA